MMTPAEALEPLRNGALVVDVEVLAAALDVSKWHLYDLVKRGESPIEPIRVGRSIRFRASDARILLGLDGES